MSEHEARRTPGEAARRARMVFEAKGTVLRGRIDALRARGHLERVATHASPELRALLRDPPTASAWVSGALLIELDDVVHDLLGEAVLSDVALATVRDALSPILRSATEGVLQLFGASPASMLARMDPLSRSTVRGMSFTWEPRGDRGGVMRVSYPASRNVPTSAFVAMRAGLVNVLEMAGAQGVVRLRPRPIDAERNAAELECSW